MRERAAQFARLAEEGANDPVIHAELHRLSLLYVAQADRIERGADLPNDPGEQRDRKKRRSRLSSGGK
jgi:hypothetical protein